MKFFALLLFLSGFQFSDIKLGDRQPVTTVGFDGGAFLDAFNAASDRPRLVLVFSPT